MSNWIDKVTKANFLPGKDNSRFYVFSKQFNALVDKVNTLLGRGTVTQATSITTGVTLNARAGVVTTVASTLAANADAAFVVTNSYVKSDSVIVLTCLNTGAGIATAQVSAVADGSFTVLLANSGNAAFNSTIGVHFLVL
jgi:hypothetical protein